MLEAPLRILASAGSGERQCHVCGTIMSKAALPSHQRRCIKRSFKRTTSRMVMSAGPLGDHTLMHPCASCMMRIPQHKYMSHLRVCKGRDALSPSPGSLGLFTSSFQSTSFTSQTDGAPQRGIVRSVRTSHVGSRRESMKDVYADQTESEQRLSQTSINSQKVYALAAEEPGLSDRFNGLGFEEAPLPTAASRNRSDPNGYMMAEYPVVQQDSFAYGVSPAEEVSEYADTPVQPSLPCSICSRKFVAQDRLDKHMVACSKAHKTRKVFDMTKARVSGTEMAQYVLKGPSKTAQIPAGPPKKKSNWRAKHEEFISAMRAAKPGANASSSSSSAFGHGAAPPVANPDYVPCPHCARRFNADSAERHIPVCAKDARMKAMKHGSSASLARASLKSGGGAAGLQKRTSYKPPTPKTPRKSVV